MEKKDADEDEESLDGDFDEELDRDSISSGGSGQFSLATEMKSQVKSISEEYSLLFKAFTNLLAKQSDENLRFLTFRFDFNGYYEERKALKVADSFVAEDGSEE
jgi:hypothetical protein